MPARDDRLSALHTLLGEVIALRQAADLVEWDERVCMPPGGAGVHGAMQATLRRLAHETFTSDEVGRLLEGLESDLAGEDADSDAVRLVKVATRDFRRATRVPPSFVAEHARVVSAAQHAWVEARSQSSFARFEPHLERVVDLKKEYVTFFPPRHHPYDVLLDEYEPGLTTAEIQSIFSELRPGQVELIRAIAERPQADGGFLRASYPESAIRSFAEDVMTAAGFDWNRGRQDTSVHPFATAIGSDDVRITTRFVDGLPFALLFGTIHETGHALYEQGIAGAYRGTLLEGGASLGIHESQSRLWENLVGRALPFWEHFFPKLQASFPSQLRDVTLDGFYRAINRVEASPIRVEADEATYNLHIMLRVDLEVALVEGRVGVKEIPDLWRQGMRDYLGIVPPDDASGVLQDVHWSAGLFGYFATYTLGNLIAAQLWEAFTNRHPEFDGRMRAGDFAPLLSWLRSELHQHGRKFEPQELVQRITGSRIDPAPYLRYLQTKYSRVYGLAATR